MPKLAPMCESISEEHSRAMAAKITNFFERVDKPLPICWTTQQSHLAKGLSAVWEDLEKSNTPPAQRMIDSDSEQSDKENTDTRLEGEVKKTKRIYTIQQKRRIAAYAMKNLVTDTHEHFNVPRATINRWMKVSC